MKLTQWYEGTQKPIHIGVYERDYEDDSEFPDYSYWDGTTWYWVGKTPVEALREFKNNCASYVQTLKWRGLAK